MTLGIVDLLLRPRWSDAHRAVLGRALTELPWCWPREARGREGLAFERAAQEFSPDPERPGPPPMRTGAFPIVTASGSAACLWTVAPSTVPAPGAVDRPLVGRALQAHDAARRALPDSLPLLWRSLQDADLRDKPLRLVAKLAHGQTDVPEHTIDGLSCGLSLYLTMASLVFRQALPHDAAASAQVDPVGRLEGVGRLPEKIELLARWAPRIGRLLVFEDQVDEARAAAGGRIEIVGVETAAEAVGEVWGGPEVVARWLVHEGRTPERRKELVDQFFRICVSGRDTLPDWNPLHRAAAVVVDAWQEQLSPVELAPLVFARAVAGRREGHTDARVALPDCEWIDDLPLDTRLLVVAHHIQHAADIGTPSFEAAGQLYERYARRGRDAHTLHFAIHGAYGRLLAVTGRPAEALLLQEEVARETVARFAYRHVSYPAAEWYRLAGALGDEESFDRAEQLWGDVSGHGAARASCSFVDLARWRAGLTLGRLDRDRVARRLAALAAPSSEAPVHLRCSALRSLAGLQRSGIEGAGDEDAAVTLEHHASNADEDDLDDAQVFWSLTRLDEALERRDQGAADAAIEALRRHKPGRMAHLLGAAAASGEERGSYIARFWPY